MDTVNNPLLEVKGLKKYFNLGRNLTLKAVDDISFSIKKGETLGLVGESGCGKSTTGRTIMRLYDPTAGQVLFNGQDLHKLSGRQARDWTQKAQMIFQDPYASLDSKMTVGDIIMEGADIHHMYSGKDRQDKIFELIETVGLGKDHANRYPHEFSGGQRQRIGIARSLAIMPEFIVCDEPISALDVSIQSQIVNLLISLQQKKELTYLFIAHDLSMVKHISDRVAVMYLGSIMEMADSEEIYRHPQHPYTQALLSAVPIPDPDVERSHERIAVKGDVPSPINTPVCCCFCKRCFNAKPICSEEKPSLKEISPGHFVACHLF